MEKVNLKKVEWVETKKILNFLGEESVLYYRFLLDKKDPYHSNATYSLYDSIDHRVSIDDLTFILYLNLADHYKYIEEGRYPYGKFDNSTFDQWSKRIPPIAPIRKWVVDKGINSEGVEYKIARSIGKYGIPPKNYFALVREKTLKEASSVIRAIETDIANFIKSKVKK